MMTASQEMLKLYDRYVDWINGRVNFTVAEAIEFQRDFRALMVRVGLMELGVDNKGIDLMIQAAEPGSNVVIFNKEKLARIAARARDGGAS